MSNGYSYILGIDLGITSIGTALIAAKPEQVKNPLLDFGVRIFPASEGALERRTYRQARKTLQRRKKRIKNLTKLLQENNLYPLDKDVISKLNTYSPYFLRAKAVTEQVSLFELGHCLLHLSKRRGASFLSQAKEIEEDSDAKSKNKTEIFYRNLENNIRYENITLGQFFAKMLPRKNKALSSNSPIRRRALNVKLGLVNHAVPRFLVKAEFYKIFEVQSEFYTNLSLELKQEIENCIFKDRPHAPYAKAYCSLLGSEGGFRLPRMHPLSEQRRIYEEVNNIRIKIDNKDYALTKEMRDFLVEKLMLGSEISTTNIIKELNLFLESENYIEGTSLKSREKIKGYAINNAFGNMQNWLELSEQEQLAIIDFIAEPRINPEDEYSTLYSDEDFMQELKKLFKLNENDHERELELSKALNKLPKDRANFGEKATKDILEELKKGNFENNLWIPISNTEAIMQAGYERSDEKVQEYKNKYPFLPYYGELLTTDVTPIHPWHEARTSDEEEKKYGKVPNPVVHVALNQLRKVINEIIKLYGKPQEIRIELAREIGKSKVKRKEIMDKQLANAKRNSEIAKMLHEHNLKVNATNILKYKLWKEQGEQILFSYDKDRKCSYNCSLGEIINCEVEHLIPRAHKGVNAYSNLALLRPNSNFIKSKQFPYQFLESLSADEQAAVYNIINSSTYPEKKRWRFSEEAMKSFMEYGQGAEKIASAMANSDPENVGRILNDTRYIARLARKYLYAICEKVQPVNGQITAKLRHLWGLDGLEYDIMDYNKASLINNETGENYKRAKPRLDHRHHALDAFVVANTTVKMVQDFVKANKGYTAKITQSDIELPLFSSVNELREALVSKLKEVKISLKPDHGLNGGLHEGTKYRVLMPHPTKKDLYLIVYNFNFDNIPNKDLTLEKIKGLYSDNIVKYKELPEVSKYYSKLEHIINSILSKIEQADKILAKEYLEHKQEGKKVIEITEKIIIKRAIHLAQEEGLIGNGYPKVESMGLAFVNSKNKYGYKSGANLKTDFYIKKDGAIGWECITRFNANQKNFVPDWKINGGKYLWSLYINDIFELNLDAKLASELKLKPGKQLFSVQKMTDGQMAFNILSDGRALDEKLNSDMQQKLSLKKGLIVFTKGQARKIILSPFGKIWQKYPKLWHGKKKV